MVEEQNECVKVESYTFVAMVGIASVGLYRKQEFVLRKGMKYE